MYQFVRRVVLALKHISHVAYTGLSMAISGLHYSTSNTYREI